MSNRRTSDQGKLILVLLATQLSCAQSNKTLRSNPKSDETILNNDIGICANNLLTLYKHLDLKKKTHSASNSHEAWTMGLPHLVEYGKLIISLEPQMPRCQGQLTAHGLENSPPYEMTYIDYVAPQGTQPNSFRDNYDKYGGKTVIFCDFRHNPPNHNLRNPAISHFGLGLTYDGTIVYQNRKGNPFFQQWWDKAKLVPSSLYRLETNNKGTDNAHNKSNTTAGSNN